MSGIEVAGLLLGAIPVLLEGLDAYKKGLRGLKAGFQKRKHVEILSHALLEQSQTLQAIVQSILLHSGCGDFQRFDDNIGSFLGDADVQKFVDDYLGGNDALVFTSAMRECNNIVEKVATKIASVVPSIKQSKNIIKIIEANKQSPKGQLEAMARVTFVFSIKDIKRDVQDLDSAINSLNRFLQLAFQNRQLGSSLPSRKATKLARCLGRVRRHAGELAYAIKKGWLSQCHETHEVRLFLDDRVDETQSTKGIATSFTQSDSNGRLPSFRLVFVGRGPNGSSICYETHVQSVEEEEEDDMIITATSSTRRPQITIIAPSRQSQQRAVMNKIKDICSAIQDAATTNEHLVFMVTRDLCIASPAETTSGFPQCQLGQLTTLSDILSHKPDFKDNSLPWKLRMVLALKLASSLVQLLQTEWIPSSWSKEAVYFLHSSPNAPIDISQPMILRSFGGTALSTGIAGTNEMKAMLLELAIMLLEIWHETSLETRIPSITTNTTYTARRSAVLEWLDDVTNPLPDLYYKAVLHCVMRPMDIEFRSLGTDDLRLWTILCEEVVEPLMKVASL